MAKLQDVSVEHTKAIERLEAQNELFLQKLRELTEHVQEDIPNRKPPHY